MAANLFRKFLISTLLGIFILPLLSRADTDDVASRIEKPVGQAIEDRRQIQREQEQWREEREKLLARFELLGQENGQLQARRDELQKYVAAARGRIADKEKQLNDIAQIRQTIGPFIQETAGRLRAAVDEDLPFLPEERHDRLARLEAVASDPEISLSEKFRKLMESLMVEAEYNSTIEVYPQTIALAGSSIRVNVFRLGRVSLFCQTLDQRTSGAYNEAQQRWDVLPHAFDAAIRAAIEIAARRQPAELLNLPLGKMKVP